MLTYLIFGLLSRKALGSAASAAKSRRSFPQQRLIHIPVLDSLLSGVLPRPRGYAARFHSRVVGAIQLACQTKAFVLMSGALLVGFQRRAKLRLPRSQRRPK